MNYTVEFKEDQKIIFAAASGEWDATTDHAMLDRVLQTVDLTGSSRVLLDIRELHFDLQMFQIFERAKQVKEQRQQFGKASTKAAIVYFAPSQKIEGDIQFFENAARNRGLPYRVFRDVEDALTWLISDSS